MNAKSFLIFSLIALSNFGAAFKVLAFLPFFATSHHKIGQSIARTLADNNNNVTIVSCFPSNDENKNFREISTEDFLASFFKGQNEKLICPFYILQCYISTSRVRLCKIF